MRIESQPPQAEILAAREQSMGPELGELFHILSGKLLVVHVFWAEYRAMFATPQSAFDVMNRTAPNFFYMLDYLMWHEVLLRISRLTDKPRLGKAENVTILALAPLIHVEGLKLRVVDLVHFSLTKASFARERRNKILAHEDRDVARAPELHPFEEATRAKVEEALSALRDTLNAVQAHFEDKITDYVQPSGMPGGAAALLRRISESGST